MQKPIVHYKSLVHCQVGTAAVVHPVDHPGPDVSNTKLARTSAVLRYDEDTGEFETRNTIYRRLPKMPRLAVTQDEKEGAAND